MEESRPKQYFIRSIINFLQGVAFIICLLAIILAIYVIILYRIRLTAVTNYAIVFDAGILHTDMFVYHWPADKSNGLGTTATVNEYFVCPLHGIEVENSVKFGRKLRLRAISDFEQNLDLLQNYFQPCLNQAIEKIPANRHKSSPIFLGATAGMRLSRLRNVTRANQILETIREIFSNTPFKFVAARQVRILTGIEEAIDGWITINILLEKFKHRHEKKNLVSRTKSQEEFDPDMVGVLDLGGTSTQVTFTYKPNATIKPVPEEFAANITLFDTVYRPYAHSYLCWGKNEALKRHRARLVNFAIPANRKEFSNHPSIRVRDPCLPLGTNHSITVDDIFRSPCTANEKEKFNKHFNKSLVLFIGAGNTSECEKRLKNLFDIKRNDPTVNCSYEKEYCTFDHTYQPPIPSNIHFIGVSGYFYAFNNLAYNMGKPERISNERYKLKDFSEDEIKQRLINVCNTSYEQLRIQENITDINERHKRGICFDSWYTWLLLTYGIGFKWNELQRLTAVNSFPTGKISWTLGYMINQTNYIPAEYRERMISTPNFIGWLTASIISAVLALAFLVLTCYLYCLRRSTVIAKDNNKCENLGFISECYVYSKKSNIIAENDHIRSNEQEL